MRLHEITIEPACIRLHGPRSVLEVRSPHPGILRLRHAPLSLTSSFVHPTLPEKTSCAVVADRALKLSAEQRDGTVTVMGEEWTIEIALANGCWAFRDASGRVLARSEAVHGELARMVPAHAYRTMLALQAPPEEVYLGFGEKVGPLDKRGMRLTFWNTDVVPHHPDTDPLYQSIPFFIGLRDGVAWGAFLDESWRSEVDVALSDPSRLVWETTGPELDLYLIVGPHPADVVKRYATLTGRPAFPPLWSLGAQQSRWGYENANDIRGVIAGYRARGLPLDCVYLDIDYMDAYKVWTWDRSRFPDLPGLAREAAAAGVRLVAIIDPGVKAEPGYPVYDEALARNFLVRTDRGAVLVGEVWPVPAVYPDLTRDEVQRWWGDWHKTLLEAGIAGFWNDMNEPSCFSLKPPESGWRGDTAPTEGSKVEGITLPYDARHGDRRHLEVHNVYALGMAKAAFEGLRRSAPEQRPFVLTRAGFAGIQRYAAVWTGDNSSHWTHLEASIPMLVGLGLSGVPFTGADIAGFVGRPSGELLTRWTQTGVFYPLMRNHSAKETQFQEPWRYGEPYLSLARASLERRYRLLPMLYTLMHEAAETGLPVLRPVLMHDPGDPDALAAFDEFFFGSDLLVAPIVRPGQRRRMVYLPRGQWLEFPNLERAGELRAGRQHYIAEAPLDVTPLWLRQGGAVPLTGPAQHTTTADWPTLEWHIHVGQTIAGRLYEDSGDGYGPSRMAILQGTHQGRVVRLERRVDGALPVSRREEMLYLYGLDAPAAHVSGAAEHHSAAGVLRLRVPADWARLEVELARD